MLWGAHGLGHSTTVIVGWPGVAKLFRLRKRRGRTLKPTLLLEYSVKRADQGFNRLFVAVTVTAV